MHLYRNARVPLVCLPAPLNRPVEGSDPRVEPWRACDVLVDGDRITRVTPAGAEPPAPGVGVTDLGHAMVLPGLLDVHTHLDKAHTWHRAPNPTGEFWDAIKVLGADSVNWTDKDLHRRASFALRCAWANGTNAVRTHVDSGGGVGAAGHAVMARLREEWAGRITLQTVALCGLDGFVNGNAGDIMNLVATHQATALGGFPQPNPDLPRQLDYLLAAAKELGVGVDLHVDESSLVHAECLRATAEAVLRNQFPYPVACGHNCSLAVQPEARALDTLSLVKAAGIGIISLPLCNLYLQGRGYSPEGAPATPRWRGLTLLHEFMEAGVPVACASDNVRDAFYAWGDLDMVEVYTQSVRLGHLDTRLEASPSVATTGPAAIMGLPTHGRVAPGSPADLVVLAATTFNELLARPAARRRLIRGETFRSAEVPAYAELFGG